MQPDPNQRAELTEIVAATVRDGGAAVDRLLPAVYAELHALAEQALAGERVGHTLSATALAHEAYLRLIDQTRVNWQSRAHFLAVAALAARRVLVDHARARQRGKRGGQFHRVSLAQVDPVASADGIDVLALHDALEQLAAEDPEEARIVEMRFFGGMTEPEIAEVLGVSAPTVRRRWRFAKTWLRRRLASGDTTVR